MPFTVFRTKCGMQGTLRHGLYWILVPNCLHHPKPFPNISSSCHWSIYSCRKGPFCISSGALHWLFFLPEFTPKHPTSPLFLLPNFLLFQISVHLGSFPTPSDLVKGFLVPIPFHPHFTASLRIYSLPSGKLHDSTLVTWLQFNF